MKFGGPSPLREPKWLLILLLLILFWGVNGYVRPLPLERLERLVFDWNILADGEDTAPSNIVLITIGEASLQKIGRWPWPRNTHAELIDRLHTAEIVMLDILFPEAGDPAEDEALAQAAAAHGRVVTVQHRVSDAGNTAYRIIPPFPRLAEVSLAGGYANIQADIDGMVRYIEPFKRIGSKLLLSFPLAGLSAAIVQKPGMVEVQQNRSGVSISPFTIPVDDQERLWIRFSSVDFPRYEYADVLSGKIRPEVFQDKIVLAGAAASGLEDFHIVPTPAGRREIPGVQLHAEIIRMIQHRQGIVRTHRWTDAGITLVWVMAGLVLGGFISPRRSALFLMAAFGLQLMAVRYLFVSKGIWIAASGPVLGMMSAYFIVTVKRFVFSSDELAIRQYSLTSIHDLLVPRDQYQTYEAYLEQNWSKIAARTGIHLLNPRTDLTPPTDGPTPLPDGPAPEKPNLTLIENPRFAFRYQLYIPLPHQNGGPPEYTLLGWHEKMPEGRVQSIAAVVLASSWYFTLLAESQARKGMLINTIDAIAAAVDAKDSETGGHSKRVARISRELAARLGLSSEIQEDIFLGALIHDIGKIGIPDAILTKRGRLTDPEMDVIRTHPDIGKNIMETVDLPDLTARAISQHHERCDGNGYPHRLSKEDLPLASRIVAVADVFDAMTQKRYYKDEMPVRKVLDIMYEQRGTQFDERVIDALIALRAPADWEPPKPKQSETPIQPRTAPKPQTSKTPA
ncbi:MAG: CHASE2 domain-containing protein [Thermodesulfobacteriota bacterium]